MVAHAHEALGERPRGVRLNPRNSAIVTARVRTAQILERLQDHVLGVLVQNEDGTSTLQFAELSASQLKAAEILLNKTLGNAPVQDPVPVGEEFAQGDRYALTDEALLWIAAQGNVRLISQAKARSRPAAKPKTKTNGHTNGNGSAHE